MADPRSIRRQTGRRFTPTTMASTLCLLFALSVFGGCAIPYPDVRQAAYGTLGPDVVVMKPGNRVPPRTSAKYQANEYPFVPGSVTKPGRTLARDDETGRAAEWGITSAGRCYPSGRIHHLHDTGPAGVSPDIEIDYVFDLSLWGALEYVTRGAPRSDAPRARRDFGLSPNDLRVLRRVKIGIRNVRYYEAAPAQLAAARAHIYANRYCRGLVSGKGAYQVVRVYEAEVYDVDLQVVDGASVNVALLKGRILSAFTKHVRGTHLFFALEAAPVGAAGNP